MQSLPQLLFFFAVLFFMLGALFLCHYLRVKVFRGPFVLFIVFLWIMIYLMGHLNYAFELNLLSDFRIQIRFSSALFTVLFTGLLLVYITEGSLPARRLILISIGAQLMLGILQLALYHAAPIYLDENDRHAARILFDPSPVRLAAGILTAVVDIVFAIIVFQFIANLSKNRFITLTLVMTLILTMALDSAIFVSLTRPGVFWEQFQSHLIYKSSIVILIALPLRVYLGWFSDRSRLSLRRGSLDIFGRLHSLEGDLTDAQAEIKAYALDLENRVKERTATIARQKERLDRELKMAQDLQAALLPDPAIIKSTDIKLVYRPMSAVSGDLYNFGQIDQDQFYIFLADISGHGVSAGMIASMCQMSLARVDFKTARPAQILDNLSHEVRQLDSSHHLTAILAFINTEHKTITYSSGGHIPQYIVDHTGITELNPTGILLGSSLAEHCAELKITYNPGDRLVFFTDCALELHERHKGESGSTWLRSFLFNNFQSSPDDCIQAFEQELYKINDNAIFHDDLSLIMFDLT